MQDPTLWGLLREIMEAGTITGSLGVYTADELMELIVHVLDDQGLVQVNNVTKTQGLREKVRALVGREKRPFVDWLLIMGTGSGNLEFPTRPWEDWPVEGWFEQVTRREAFGRLSQARNEPCAARPLADFLRVVVQHAVEHERHD